VRLLAARSLWTARESRTFYSRNAGVNIEVMYSDHDNQLILVVDDIGKARAVSREWAGEGT
jgi:hypothetical protein